MLDSEYSIPQDSLVSSGPGAMHMAMRETGYKVNDKYINWQIDLVEYLKGWVGARGWFDPSFNYLVLPPDPFLRSQKGGWASRLYAHYAHIEK